MQAIPLFDTQVLCQVICHIADETVEIALDCAGDVLCDGAEEGSYGCSRRRGT